MPQIEREVAKTIKRSLSYASGSKTRVEPLSTRSRVSPSSSDRTANPGLKNKTGESRVSMSKTYPVSGTVKIKTFAKPQKCNFH